MTARQIDIALQGRDHLSQMFKKAESLVNNFDRQIERVNNRMKRFGTQSTASLRSAGASGKASLGGMSGAASMATGSFIGLKGGIAGVVAAAAGFIAFRVVKSQITESTQEALKLETGLAKVATMLDTDVPGAMKKFGPSIRKAQKDFAQSTDAMTGGLFDLISSGQDPERAAELLRVGGMTAAAGFTDTATAIDAMTSTMNAYGISADDAMLVSDLLFNTMKEGKITYEQLAQNIGNLVPTSAATGNSLQDTAAALATIVQVKKPEQAVTALRAAMNAAAKEGTPFLEFIERFKGQGKSAILQAGIGEEAADGIAILAGRWDELQEQMAKSKNVAGTVEDAFGKVASTGEFKIEQLKQKWKSFQGTMGQKIIDSRIFQGAIDTLGYVLDNFFELAELGWNSFEMVGLSAALMVIGGWNDLVHTVKELPAIFEVIWTMISQAGNSVFLGLKENAASIWDNIKRGKFDFEIKPLIDPKKFDWKEIETAVNKLSGQREATFLEKGIAAEIGALEERQRELNAKIEANKSTDIDIQKSKDKEITTAKQDQADKSQPQAVAIVQDFTATESRFLGLEAMQNGGAPAEALMRASDQIAHQVALGMTASAAIDRQSKIDPSSLQPLNTANQQMLKMQEMYAGRDKAKAKALDAINESSTATADGIAALTRELKTAYGKVQVTIYPGAV